MVDDLALRHLAAGERVDAPCQLVQIFLRFSTENDADALKNEISEQNLCETKRFPKSIMDMYARGRQRIMAQILLGMLCCLSIRE